MWVGCRLITSTCPDIYILCTLDITVRCNELVISQELMGGKMADSTF